MDLSRQIQMSLRIGLIMILLYSGWIFLGRYLRSGRGAAGPNSGQAAREADWLKTYGGSEVRILQFYARESSVIEGSQSVICYGVLNAKSVRMEPPVSGVSVALSKCVEIAPMRNTRYTLIAEGNDGRIVSESFILGVKPDVESLPKITSFQVLNRSTDYRGRLVFLISFSQQNGLEVSIDPPVFRTLEGAPNGRWYVAPEKTTTYTLTVTGKFGHRVQRQLRLEVPGT